MSKTIYLDYCGMGGEGKTIKEAKLDATRKIENALSADYIPRYTSFKGNTILIWRSPNSLHSALLHNGKIEGFTVYQKDYDIKQIEEQCRLHLAEIAWNFEEDLSPFLDYVGDKNTSQFKKWVSFQKAYKVAREQGKSDHEAHTIACMA